MAALGYDKAAVLAMHAMHDDADTVGYHLLQQHGLPPALRGRDSRHFSEDELGTTPPSLIMGSWLQEVNPGPCWWCW